MKTRFFAATAALVVCTASFAQSYSQPYPVGQNPTACATKLATYDPGTGSIKLWLPKGGRITPSENHWSMKTIDQGYGPKMATDGSLAYVPTETPVANVSGDIRTIAPDGTVRDFTSVSDRLQPLGWNSTTTNGGPWLVVLRKAATFCQLELRDPSSFKLLEIFFTSSNPSAITGAWIPDMGQLDWLLAGEGFCKQSPSGSPIIGLWGYSFLVHASSGYSITDPSVEPSKSGRIVFDKSDSVAGEHVYLLSPTDGSLSVLKTGNGDYATSGATWIGPGLLATSEAGTNRVWIMKV